MKNVMFGGTIRERRRRQAGSLGENTAARRSSGLLQYHLTSLREIRQALTVRNAQAPMYHISSVSNDRYDAGN